MPELPEVETVRTGLEPVMHGAIISKLQLNRPDLRFPFPDELAQRVQGKKIIALGRRAKFLTLDMEDGWVMVCHLGMSGSFRIQADPIGSHVHEKGKDPKHDHMIFHLDNESGEHRVIYNDPRRFGYVQYVERRLFDQHKSFQHLGPEPTSNSLSADYLAEVFQGKTTNIKSALLDQRIIAGLGNIYVCEALWRAKISPKRECKTLVTAKGKAKAELVLLCEAIIQVIADAIKAGGSSLNDYVQADGSMGYFQHSFNTYGREGKKCKVCSSTIERIVQSGRSTFYCSKCQK